MIRLLDWLRRRLFPVKPKPSALTTVTRPQPTLPPKLPPVSQEDRDRLKALLDEGDQCIPFGFADSMPPDMTIPADLAEILPEKRTWH